MIYAVFYMLKSIGCILTRKKNPPKITERGFENTSDANF